MNRTYKHIEIIPYGTTEDERPMHLVRNRRSAAVLATVMWYPRWKQYVAEFTPNTVWSAGCLRDVQEFMSNLETTAPLFSDSP